MQAKVYNDIVRSFINVLEAAYLSKYILQD